MAVSTNRPTGIVALEMFLAEARELQYPPTLLADIEVFVERCRTASSITSTFKFDGRRTVETKTGSVDLLYWATNLNEPIHGEPISYPGLKSLGYDHDKAAMTFITDCNDTVVITVHA